MDFYWKNWEVFNFLNKNYRNILAKIAIKDKKYNQDIEVKLSGALPYLRHNFKRAIYKVS